MLKALDVIGFKSFADKTRFDFSPGITGVVGPNGSGKSNVVDAVKWILGNQSAKSLRGKEMTDVIFNGATGRKGTGFAEATLTFDNTSGFLPTEMQEVRIGRRIWSSGDAEYLLNDQTARLKDIKDLLSGSGIGVSAYCIIEQGRVDQILQSNPANRRQVFEEAAGISRFKGRKAEAERRLERVEQNLQRLTDIVDEVEARLNSTRSQAVKAAKYRELSDELKQLWLGLAADDFRKSTATLKASAEKLATAQNDQEEINERQTRLDSQLHELDQSISRIEDEIRDADRVSSDFRQKIATHRTTIRHQLARQQEMETELVRLRRQRVIMINRLNEAEQETARTRTVLDEQSRDYETLKLSLQQKQNSVEGLIETVKARRAAVQELRKQLLELTRKQAETRSRAANIQNLLEQSDDSERELEIQTVELRQQIARAEAELLEQNDELRAAVENAQSHEAAIEQQLAQRNKLRDEQTRLKQEVARLREERSALQARKTVLEDLETRQEGIGLGEREIFERAEKADLAPWNKIRGSVSDRIEVDLEHAALVEVALGSRAHLILIDQIQPLIDYLHHNRSPIQGRVGFHPLPDEESSQTVREDLFDEPGVVTRADRLARSPGDDNRLVRELLAQTWIVETLQIAHTLSNGKGRHERFVTLQGELLEADGSLYVGKTQESADVLSRRSELKRLKNQLVRLEQRIETDQSRAEKMVRDAEELQNGIDASRLSLQKRKEIAAELKNVAVGSQSEMSRSESRLAEIGRKQQELLAKRAKLESEREQIDVQQHSQEESLTTLNAQIALLEREEIQAEQQLHEHDQHLAADKLELAKQEERVISLKQSFERLTEDLKMRRGQQQETSRRCEQAGLNQRETTLTILNTEAELALLYLEEQDISLLAEAHLVRKDEARLQRGRLQHQETEIRQKRREVSDQIHQLEIQVRDLNHQLQSLNERIEEEYQLVLSDVAETGVSAMRLYLEGLSDGEAESTDENSESESTSADDPLIVPPEHDYDEIHDELENRVNRLRRKIKLMGSVDTESLANLDELEQRFTHLSTQLEDLVEARNSLDEIIRKINTESKRLFAETFATIREHFHDLFRKLFGGGEGDIILEDPEDILECGVEIVARPPGKELRSISLLSGGEKTMTAVAMLMAIFKSRPSPFCILDEVDAALDEANIDRFIGVLKEFQDSTQFILITHRKPSMTVCDVLYGVTMEQSGVSKRMSVRFDDVNDNGEFRTSTDGNEASQPDAA